jgi:hypothetical protein
MPQARSGIEQGFTILRRPVGSGSIALTLDLAGSLRATRVGQQIRFLSKSGQVALSCGGLSAVDATGRLLPASIALAGKSLVLRVDDRGARYPLRIDPFVQQGAALVPASGEEEGGQLGYTVALSADGNTALVGGYSDHKFTGAVWVFVRFGSTWVQQGSKLTATGEVGEGMFGVSVALSADGNTALVGGVRNNAGVGAAWVFARSGAVWAQQAMLTATAPEEIGKGEFGESVALSADGNTALIGAYGDSAYTGAAWVFTRSGGTWSQQGGKLTGNEESGFGEFGYSVALSGDGASALIGGTGDNASTGAAWAFTRSGSTWSQLGTKLTGEGESGTAEFGQAVALSTDGLTAIVTGPHDGSGVGAAWGFTRGAGGWIAQGAKIVPSEEVGGGRFGWAVALSSDGDTALFGAPNDNKSAGAAWVFVRAGSTWLQQGEKLAPGGEADTGHGVALSADGDTALLGSPGGSTVAAGAVSVFVDAPSAASTFAASGVTATAATLSGAVAPGASSSAYFQYGTTSSYGATTAPNELALLVPGYGAPLPPGTPNVIAALSGLAPSTTYHYRLVASNSGGVSYGADQSFTTLVVPVISVPVTPVITSASESHRSWREGSKLARISKARKAPLGTTFSFTLNEQARVSFAFTQRVAGRRFRATCVVPMRRNRHKPSCKRIVTRGTLVFIGHAGVDHVAFQGRLAGGRKLPLGVYTLVITAVDAGGRRAVPGRLAFTIVR